MKDIKTVGQLIEALKKYPVDMPIGIETDSYTTKVSEPIVATHSLSNRIRGARTVSGPLTAIYQGGPNQYLSEETAEAMHKMDQGEGIELLTKPVLLLVGEEPYEQ